MLGRRIPVEGSLLWIPIDDARKWVAGMADVTWGALLYEDEEPTSRSVSTTVPSSSRDAGFIADALVEACELVKP